MTTVLIVDDEPDIVLLVRMNLEVAGYDVLEAGDGEQALEAISRFRPDVVILDVMMPKIDGWEVLRRLKAHDDEELRTIPVVMLTALGGPQDQVRGGIEGAVVYLAKPVLPDDLLEAVVQAVEGGPEPAQRKAAQQRALERLARIERGDPQATPLAAEPRPRLGRLEHAPRTRPDGPSDPETPASITLTATQRSLLKVLQQAPSVSDAAAELGTSRSNIYASLRRVGRKLDERDVSRLLRRLRAGGLDHLLVED